MVRGRRLKTVKVPEVIHNISTAETVDCKDYIYLKKDMDVCNDFSPPITRSRKNARLKRLSSSDSVKNGHITNYFQIVSTVKCYENGKTTPILRDENIVDHIDECREYEEIKSDHFQFDLNDIVYSDKPDNKKLIIKNIFKRESSILTYSDINSQKLNGINKCENILTDDNEDKKYDDIEFCNFSSDKYEKNYVQNTNDSLSLRLSPRKHASTLQRCAALENNITPHRINLCEKEATPSHSIKQVTYRTHNRRLKKRAATKTNEKKTKSNEINECGEILPEKLDLDEKDSKITTKLSKFNGVSNTQSHKLTEYFPVRRSVRKTKKEVMEEKKRDLELAIEEQREEGLLVASIEGKGRGVVASRTFHKGDFVVEYVGDLVDLAEARIREAKYAQDHATGCYMYYFRYNNQNYCIDATAESGRLGRLVNHSRNGNLITRSVFSNSKPHLVLIANQDISPGEEITYDYGDRSKESLQHHPWLAL